MTLGYGAAAFSAWLGGHLSFAKGVGVNQTAFEEAPSDWTPAIDEEELAEGALVGTHVEAIAVVLARSDGRIYALADRCSRRGCSLHEGRLNEDDTITCPCHGSTFRLHDGSIVKGPATSPQPTLDARTEEGRVQVRRSGAD